MMRKLTHQDVAARQNKISGAPFLPFTVVLNNIRSLYNVGSIFRTCDGAGVEKVWLCGITGHPPDAQIAKTALGAQDYVPWEHRWDILPVLTELKSRNYQIILLEQMEESCSYETFVPRAPVCLVLGNEITGVSPQVNLFCDAAVDIEMAGEKNSLNVAVAFGIIAYRFRACLKNKFLS